MERACFIGQNFYKYDRLACRTIKSFAKMAVTYNNVTEFLVGNRGIFDFIAASEVRSLKKEFPHIKLYLVVPKTTKDMLIDKSYYDGIIDLSVSGFGKTKKCYKYMIDESEHVISYIKYSIGYAAKAEKYAKKQNKIVDDGFGITNVIKTVNHRRKIGIKQ